MSAGDRPAADALAEGLALQIGRLSQRHGAPAEAVRVARAAALALSRAAADGEVCIGLERVGDGAAGAQVRSALLASRVVGEACAPGPRPIVLDGDRLYLHRYFDHECRLAARVRERIGVGPEPVPATPLLRAATGEVDWQRLAAALALRNRLTVISGGPGTGKTTLVATLLAVWLQDRPAARVALAAPTGKAAARMVEALRERAASLPEGLRARLPEAAVTVHRLLGIHPATGRPRHDAANPLPLDLLVVDEGSMLDLALARRLFDALPTAARLVLLGDKDQLAAVEAGSVFADLAADPRLGPACIADLAAATGVQAAQIAASVGGSSGAGEATGAPCDAVVWLRRSWRFVADSPIARLAAAVNAGDGEAALAVLGMDGRPALQWFDEPGRTIGAAALEAMRAGYAPYLDAVRRRPHDPAGALAALARFSVLAAVRDGPRGVLAINEALERTLRGQARDPWYAGRPVIVTRNAPLLGLANGDVGVVLPDASGAPCAWFPAGDQAQPRPVAVARMPPHETAFALTVHKAQGSEFDAVHLVLPDATSPVLGRELVYTGITRARRALQLSAPAQVVVSACRRSGRREGGIARRLAAAAPGLGTPGPLAPPVSDS